ncbi:MAG: pyruvate kinase [Clostridiales Family XIII bacterium]|jgi:pyruvate kinase|nr:pyruvate kinase [Clostridiales Family XIII bacterium]
MGKGQTDKIRKTKIICTLGPATNDYEKVLSLVQAGMNGARFNFSHGTHEEHLALMDLVKKAAKETGTPIALILDTKGPEIRTGTFEGGSAMLTEGSPFTLRTYESVGDSSGCSVSYSEIAGDVVPGSVVLIDDGLVGLTVTDIKDDEVLCRVDNGGVVSDHKSINLPGTHVNLPSLTEQDKKDILFGIEQDIDYIAASFTRSGSDVAILRELLDHNAGGEVKIISKIENSEGLENIDSIIAGSDAIMLARGDLGVEIPPEDVPPIQKRIIAKCTAEGKPIITATQLLDSMMRNPRPTRAEVADIANAVYDGTDCLMLSGETAAGSYPEESIEMMSRVAIATEDSIDYSRLSRAKKNSTDDSITNAIALAVIKASEATEIKAILAPTSSGYTARIVSLLRPDTPVIGFATTSKVTKRMALYWGVEPYQSEYESNITEFYRTILDTAEENGKISKGDTVIMIAGLPIGIGGTTNVMRIHKVGESL